MLFASNAGIGNQQSCFTEEQSTRAAKASIDDYHEDNAFIENIESAADEGSGPELSEPSDVDDDSDAKTFFVRKSVAQSFWTKTCANHVPMFSYPCIQIWLQQGNRVKVLTTLWSEHHGTARLQVESL